MKKLLSLLLISISLMSFSQEKTIIDVRLMNGFNSFIYESRIRGLDLEDEILQKLDSIVFSNDKDVDTLAGVYIPEKKIIKINEKYLHINYVASVIVIHELTHLFINGHYKEPGHIMSKELSNKIFLYTEEDWNFEMDIIFNKIKQIKKLKNN